MAIKFRLSNVQDGSRFGLGLLAAVLAVNAFQSSLAVNFDTRLEEGFERLRQFSFLYDLLVRLIGGAIIAKIWGAISTPV